MMNTYLAKQLPAHITTEQKTKEVNMKNINKEGIPRLLKQHGPILIWLTHNITGINAQK